MRDPNVTARAQQMRRDMPDAEVRLWLALRAKRFGGVKFRRQKVVGSYIVDFASRGPLIAIELDGATHAGCEGHDAARTRFLEGQGYRVLRFTNAEVMTNLEGVLLTLEGALGTPPLPTLSPEGERAL